MKPIGILYATREGQTERIAQHIADALDVRGFTADVRNVRYDAPAIKLGDYTAVILAASVHCGKHEREMIRFIKDHLVELQHMPAAFLSVTLSQAGVELPSATNEQHALSAADVQQVLAKFHAATAWHPKYLMSVAGALRYSKYNFLIRFVMKRIARQSGGPTDTSRDHEYTNWTALDRFVVNFAMELSPADVESEHRPAC
jgi:menaquinone-dependent protoporphyrinogen oxidase